MGLTDIIWMVLIIAGAGYVLYRSIWKKGGYCHGCQGECCSGKRLEDKWK